MSALCPHPDGASWVKMIECRARTLSKHQRGPLVMARPQIKLAKRFSYRDRDGRGQSLIADLNRPGFVGGSNS